MAKDFIKDKVVPQHKFKKREFSFVRHIHDLFFVVIICFVLVFQIVTFAEYMSFPIDEETGLVICNNDCISFLFENETYLEFLNIIETYVNSIIIVLFPLVTSIIAISISASKEEIYGINLSQFRKLNTRSTYSIVGMLVLSYSIILASILSLIFNYILLLFVLNVIAFVYTIIFSVLEIPLLVRNDRKTSRIIKNSYCLMVKTKYKENLKLSSNETTKKYKTFSEQVDGSIWEHNLHVVMGNYIEYLGLINIYKKINKNKKYSFLLLNELMSDFYEHSVKNALVNAVADEDVVKNSIDYTKFFFDIFESMNSNEEFSYNCGPVANTVYYLILFFSDKNNSILSKHYEVELYQIIDCVTPGPSSRWDDNHVFYLKSICNYMIVKAIMEEKTLFINFLMKFIEDYNYFDQSYTFTIYFSLFLSFVIKRFKCSDGFRKDLNNLVDETWTSMVKKRCFSSRWFKDIDLCPAFLNDLIKHVDCLEKTLFDNNIFYHTGFACIDKDYIISFWIKTLFIKNSPIDSAKILKQVLNSLNLDCSTKNTIKRVFYEQWMTKKMNKANAMYCLDDFFKTYGVDLIDESSKKYFSFMSVLTVYAKTNPPICIVTQNELKNECKLIKTNINNAFKSFRLYDSGANWENKKSKVGQYCIQVLNNKYDSIKDGFNLNDTNGPFFESISTLFTLENNYVKLDDNYDNVDFLKKIIQTDPKKYKKIKVGANKIDCIKLDSKNYYNIDSIKVSIVLAKHQALKVDEKNVCEINDLLDHDYFNFLYGFYDSKKNRRYVSRNDVKEECGYQRFEAHIPIQCQIKIDTSNMFIPRRRNNRKKQQKI